MSYCYVRFTVGNEQKYQMLDRMVHELRAEVAAARRRPDEDWKVLFGAEALTTFWWPSDQELKEWERVWFGTPSDRRHLIPPTRWGFDSLIDALLNNEWVIVGLHRLNAGHALLEFDPQAYPYGGIGALMALVEAFGHSIVEYDDGTGAQAYVPVDTYWQPSPDRST